MISLLLFSCKKIADENYSSPEQTDSFSRNPDANCNLSTTICEDCVFQEQVDNDTADYATVLGNIYNNPYSIQNMTAAYNYIYSSNVSALSATHYYVRYKPTSREDLNLLDSFDVELYDYPLNREVIQDGDYWPEAYNNLLQNEYPWLYSVIEKSFVLPGNIQTEILESLYIPDDNQALEDEAYYITGNTLCNISSYLAEREATKNYYKVNPNYIDPCWLDPEDCGGGGGGGGGGINTNLKPKGMINFKVEQGMVSSFIGASAPLKYVRVVGKRFFKIDKTYTDANGNFQFSKSFPRKVTIVVKFRASESHGRHSVRLNTINAGVWRSMFPMKKNIGTYKGNNLQNLNYQFQKGSTSTNRKTRHWLGAVIMNTAEETKLFINEKGMTPLPNDLRLYLYAPGEQHINEPQYDFLRGTNVPYLNQDRKLFSDILHYLLSTVSIGLGSGGIYYVLSKAVLSATSIGVATIIGMGSGSLSLKLVPQHPDVYFYYRTSDINSLTASKVSISAAQQLGLIYLFKIYEQGQTSGLGRFEYDRSMAYVINNYLFSEYAPYGNGVPANAGSNYYPGLVGIWQSYAQHIGHTITDRIYGNGAGEFSLQGKQWASDFNKSSNLKYLEDFDPQIGAPADYFNWIPVGLITDLIDNSEPPSSNVNDQVTGFTYSEIQSALTSKPSTLLEFRNLLKNIKPFQSVQIDQLFASYGY